MTPYYQHDGITIYCGDNRDVLPQLGKFDLLLTDPPYGIGADNRKRILSRANGCKVKDYGESNWDNAPPDDAHLALAMSAGEKQIIWGGNYFNLPPCVGPLIWDKENSGDFADGELAWNNLGTALRIKRHLWNGMIRKGHEPRFHPTQKPVEIMAWCISLAKETKSVIDPWMGSGTTLVAAKQFRIPAVGIEISESDCETAVRRLSQSVLFS